jgi:(1->4)-alpha-D-glucan 1-alpha-D-glucosylmutase
MRPATVFRVNLRPELRDANGVVIDRGITMNDVAEIAPILAELGVDTIYVSPLYAGINPDAAHGYHPKNMNELNETLGGMAGYEAAVAGASRLGLKLLIDTVPNHMGFDPSNVWLAETLEFGRNSPMARLFEVDWNLPGLEDRMLVPKLGAPFEQVVAEGGIRFRLGAGDRPGIVQDAGGVWPVAPATYDEILADARDRLTGADRRKVVNLLKAIERLKEKPRTEAERADHVTQGRAVARTLDELVAKSPEIKHAVEQALERVNGSPERVRDLSERQHYRLDDWHLRLSDNGYLLFFDVEELIALRQQDPEVRRITHQGQWRWLDIARNHNVPAGLRIDHPDGLKKPGQYIEYIQREFFLRRVKEIAELDPDESYPAFEARVLELRDALIAADPDTIARDPLYVVVEKILTDGEPLPEGWKAHVNGTVGYEAMAAITKVLVHPAAADAMAGIYERFTGDTRAYADVVFQSKLDVMEGMALRNGTRVSPRLEYNLKRVTRRLVPVAAADGKTFTERQLREGIAAIVAAYPDYRPYTVDDDGVRLDRRGRQQIVKAAAEAKRRLPDRAPVIDYVAEVLRREGMRALVEDFADVFGQLTAPAAGVGEENTAFFRIFRDLYEVGGEPGRRMTPQQFHAFNRLRQLAGLLGLTELSTHDSKWSVAARARIMALAADPAAYETAINRMAEIAKDYPELQDNGEIAPDRSEMYRMFMLLIATLPFEEITSGKASPQYDELIRFQVKKALNEAKVNTDWINANEEWTTAVLAYLDKVLADDRFRAELRQFIQREVVVPAVATSLANRVLQMLMPGVPDIYQGDVLGQAASGLDPMNRATPDFSELQYRLRNPDGNGEDWLDYWMSGKADTAVMQRLANARKADPALYLDGEYLGVGDVSDDAPYIACARVHEGPSGPSCVIGFTPRIGAPGTPAFPLGEEWGDLTVPMPEKLPAGTYENLLDPDAPHLTITPAGSSAPPTSPSGCRCSPCAGSPAPPSSPGRWVPRPSRTVRWPPGSRPRVSRPLPGSRSRRTRSSRAGRRPRHQASRSTPTPSCSTRTRRSTRSGRP